MVLNKNIIHNFEAVFNGIFRSVKVISKDPRSGALTFLCLIQLLSLLIEREFADFKDSLCFLASEILAKIDFWITLNFLSVLSKISFRNNMKKY